MTSLVLHPFFFAKSVSPRQIPLIEHHEISAVPEDAQVWHTYWPKTENYKPNPLPLYQDKTIKQVAASESYMPVTVTPDFKREPQTIASDVLFEARGLFYRMIVSDRDFLLLGRTIVLTPEGKKSIIDMYEQRFYSILTMQYARGLFVNQPVRIETMHTVRTMMRVAFWDQVKRVNHTQAGLALVNGPVIF